MTISYFTNSKRPAYAFLFAGILLVFVELFDFLFLRGSGVMNGAEKWLSFLVAFIPGGTLTIFVVNLFIGVYLVWSDTQEGVKLSIDTFWIMLFESLIWAILIYLLLPSFIAKLLPNQINLPMQAGAVLRPSLIQEIALSLSAGFFEELLFRLLLVQGVLWFLGTMNIGKGFSSIRYAIILLAALLFSAVHYIPPFGDPFEFWSFTYRAAFGLIMNALLVLRGFGIVAWTHALYDILVFSLR